VLARLGGDEFAVLLPNTDLEHARLAAESLREVVGEGRPKPPFALRGAERGGRITSDRWPGRRPCSRSCSRG
jgi:GGDEF domain-containing protein